MTHINAQWLCITARLRIAAHLDCANCATVHCCVVWLCNDSFWLILLNTRDNKYLLLLCLLSMTVHYDCALLRITAHGYLYTYDNLWLRMTPVFLDGTCYVMEYSSNHILSYCRHVMLYLVTGNHMTINVLRDRNNLEIFDFYYSLSRGCAFLICMGKLP